ncbi:HNH endonuclease family protein [Bifidobacterium choloepi]|uniref:HNH endonuclease n=1 Tax=Bifidobacterium choloepi TaxID=2614131 RepID=A0A6I5N1H8_9BIFI|nr:HNH endonuclease family protein [Bifidobacterium choloepi]NEG70467.1 HNH endonuclease [Bifidobacterium choloepi]
MGRRSNSYFRRRRRRNRLGERIVALIVAAVLLGVTAGTWLPKVSTTVARVTGQYAATGTAAETLQKLVVDDDPDASGYSRDVFGYRTTDDDGNGCDVRDDVLARDLTDVAYKSGSTCVVQSGVLDDPYTGADIRFTRGQATSSAVQIDHVVALQNAWQSGARDWDSAKLVEYGNDMYNLLAVDGTANQEKGSASAAYWLPTNGDFRCEYVALQIGVKDKYSLTVTSAEKDAMLSVLHGCPAQEIPADNS